MFSESTPSPLQEIDDPALAVKQVKVWIKRDDLLHPFISGNKWRKLKYNIQSAKREKFGALLTFGGAYSNHIYATASAAKENGIKSIGIIRGEEHLPLNPTLAFAAQQGMKLVYIDREAYRLKDIDPFRKELEENYGKLYLIPEGGTNALAIQGSMETIAEIDIPYEYLVCSVGTGGTISGLIADLQDQKKVLGFSALKGDFLKEEITRLLKTCDIPCYQNWDIITDYHFNGYARISPTLIRFIKDFNNKHGILLDPIYTGKMMYGLFNLIEKDYFPTGSKIIVLHTGGLQGWTGIKDRYENKPQYDFSFLNS